MVDLHLLHGVRRQVVEHLPVVALEEVRAVQCQVVHLAPVHVNLAVLLQFHPRHLPDQLVEHRPFGQVERIGIIDQRVSLVGHPDLRGLHHHLVQRPVRERVVRLAPHLMVRRVHVSVPPDAAEAEIHIRGQVVRMLGLDDEPLRHCRHIELVITVHLRRVRIEIIHVHSVHHRAVRPHQRDQHAADARISESVLHMPPQFHCPSAGRALSLRTAAPLSHRREQHTEKAKHRGHLSFHVSHISSVLL